jgi:hypothetical protein
MGDKKWKTCTCGLSGGRYVDDLNAEMFGEFAVPLGLDNRSLVEAIKNQPEKDWGERFNAFVIQKECSTIKIVATPKKGKKK